MSILLVGSCIVELAAGIPSGPDAQSQCVPRAPDDSVVCCLTLLCLLFWTVVTAGAFVTFFVNCSSLKCLFIIIIIIIIIIICCHTYAQCKGPGYNWPCLMLPHSRLSRNWRSWWHIMRKRLVNQQTCWVLHWVLVETCAFTLRYETSCTLHFLFLFCVFSTFLYVFIVLHLAYLAIRLLATGMFNKIHYCLFGIM